MNGHEIDLERFGLRVVAIGALKTSLAKVRGDRQPPCQPLTPAPIRVLADPEDPGTYEVVDGFKRLAAYLEEGLGEVVVLVELAAESIPVRQQGLSLLLRANAQTRTLSPMDEARAVRSLVVDEGLTPVAASRLLGKGKPWVSKRLALARKLAGEVGREVESGRLTLSVAYALSALPRGDQTQLARQLVALRLPSGQALQLIEAYRVAPTPAERQALVADPAGFLAEADRGGKGGGEVISVSRCVRERIAAYRRLASLLRALEREPHLEGLTPNEARLLAAERRRLEARIAAHAEHQRRGTAAARQSTP